MQGKKKCSKCGEMKDIEEFYKDKSNSNGTMSYCKQCGKKMCEERNKRKYSLEHLKRIEKYRKNRKIDKQLENTDKKRCSKCGNIKLKNHFDKNKSISNHDGGYCSWCKKCRHKYSDKGRILDYNRKYRKENKEIQSERRKEYRGNNREKLSKNRKEYYFKTKANNHEILLQKAMRYNEKNKDENNKKAKNMRDNILDSYVKGILYNQTGISACDIPIGLIEAKRSQIKLHRSLRAIKSVCS